MHKKRPIRGEDVLPFVRQGHFSREMEKGRDIEYVVVEVWLGEESLVVVNFYNPCP